MNPPLPNSNNNGHLMNNLFTPATRLAVACAIALPMLLSTAHAAQPVQQSYASAEQATEALAAAWHEGQRTALLKVFGPVGWKLVSSNDPVAEQEARERLAAEYDSAHRLETVGPHTARLIVGTDEFPYPVPILEHNGRWRFDTAAGIDEILDRRVGRNELDAIAVCRAYVEAQREYAAADHVGHRYASKLVSADGSHDGLYWPVTDGEVASPIGPLMARAAAEGYGRASGKTLTPYHGYYYRMLSHPAGGRPAGAPGFALIAFPARYGNSGVLSYIVSEDGVVYAKNLGPGTDRVARQMTLYQPDPSWSLP